MLRIMASWFPRVLGIFIVVFLATVQAHKPSVMVAMIVRNVENLLPYYLGGLEKQQYPTQRMHLWIRTDCNMDGTTLELQRWHDQVKDFYASLDFREESCQRPMDKFPFSKDSARLRHIESLRDEAMEKARILGLDYLMFLDSSAFLVDPFVIGDLIDLKLDIVGPFLPSLNKYGNFWCNITNEGRYRKSSDCVHVFEFESLGVFDVALVHSAFLIDMKSSKTSKITFSSGSNEARSYQQFLMSARKSGVKISIINEKQYGYSLAPMTNGSTLYDQLDAFRNLYLEVLVTREEISISEHISPDTEDPDTLGFDHIYFINLDRRPNRRIRLEKSFDILNLEVERIRAVDGQNLDYDLLEKLGIKMLPSYEDPFKKRPMTMGEYGCFLSHYAIWRDVVEKGFRRVLVFEDDIRFDYYFRQRVAKLWRDIERLELEWDLIYLGRKRLVDEDEPYVKGTTNLVHVGYSYWTLCYMLSASGASKLLAGLPLTKMIPVDEYLPVMFDRHPNAEWKSHFPERNLIAFSAYPLLVYPSHYTGEEGYISDTENSPQLNLNDELDENDEDDELDEDEESIVHLEHDEL